MNGERIEMEEKDFEMMTEEEFLAQYNPNAYEKPSVTVDMLVFTMNENQQLELLLIRRKGHPCRGKWAIPGGFINMDETLEEAAARELEEETGLTDIYLEQLYTFGAVHRDVRMRVISVAYMALVPPRLLKFQAGDDAADACLYEIKKEENEVAFYSGERKQLLTREDLAFDHYEIIQTALERLQGKIRYTDIALELLRDKEKFSIYELQMIHEAQKGEKIEVANFRRSFKKKFIDTGRVEKLEEKCMEYSKKPSSYYKLVQRF